MQKVICEGQTFFLMYCKPYLAKNWQISTFSARYWDFLRFFPSKNGGLKIKKECDIGPQLFFCMKATLWGKKSVVVTLGRRTPERQTPKNRGWRVDLDLSLLGKGQFCLQNWIFFNVSTKNCAGLLWNLVWHVETQLLRGLGPLYP